MVAWTGQFSSCLICNFPLLLDLLFQVLYPVLIKKKAPVLYFIWFSYSGGPHSDRAQQIFCPWHKADTEGDKKKTIFKTVNSSLNSSPADVDIKANWKLWKKCNESMLTLIIQETALPYLAVRFFTHCSSMFLFSSSSFPHPKLLKV